MVGGRGGDKKEIDPEVLMKQKFRAKCRFRAIGRLVMANTYWMMEVDDTYEGDDVKKRVEQAVRLKTRKKQLLTIKDKALLNKPAQFRTDQEKRYLYRIIGGLKCFKRYPTNVKKKLAALTYFKYYGPDRVIVRQNQEAHALYFIVTGKVTVSKLEFDELLNKNISVDIGVMMAGDMFGEVSLLHNILRTATVTTDGDCELLCLMKEDFKGVLQASLQKQWDEVKRAMSVFTYFDSLDEVARREGCIVARLKTYEINDILLGDGNGVANYVYFILSGICQMIESLDIEISESIGHLYFTLHDHPLPPAQSEQDLDKKYFYAYQNLYKESAIYGIPSPEESLTAPPKHSRSRILSTRQHSVIIKDEHLKREPSMYRHKSSVHIHEKYTKHSDHVRSDSGIPKFESKLFTDRKSLADIQSASASGSNVKRAVSGDSKTLLSPSAHLNRQSTRFSLPSVPVSVTEPPPTLRNPPRMKTIFMQVCQLNPGSSFGFGENMRDRRIVALTPVYCMLMPKVWLLQRNSANIWTRIHHYLEKKIPTKKQLFKEFVKQRRWEEYKTILVDDIVSRSNTVNYTTVHDVPYSIRMEELFEI